jgi:ribosomal protein S18 acetylase RimI-like enzyme
MDRDGVRGVFDGQMRRGAGPEGPGVRVERGGGVVRQVGGAVHEWNGVVWSDLDEATADAAIAEQLRWLASPEGAGREFEWKLYSHDRPADLGERLLAAGFVPDPPETLMVAEVDALLADTALTGPPPEGVRVEAVTGADGVHLLADTHEQAFGTSAGRLREQLLDSAATPDSPLTMVVAFAGDLPVCAARMEFHPGTDFASLWGGGTVEAWRGRGIYRSLIAHRARIAAAHGYRYLQVDASDQSRPILERLGFAALSVTTPYLKQA